MTEKLIICYRHSDFVVINKPHRISVHKDEKSVGLATEIAEQLGVERVWLVHRLDKVTSGLLIFALDKETAVRFYHLFAQHKIQKNLSRAKHEKAKEETGENCR